MTSTEPRWGPADNGFYNKFGRHPVEADHFKIQGDWGLFHRRQAKDGPGLPALLVAKRPRKLSKAKARRAASIARRKASA